MRAQSRQVQRNWIWLVLTLAAVAGWAVKGILKQQFGWDFTQFYVAAHAPIRAIHDQLVFQETARQVLPATGVRYLPPYVRPAVFALPLRWMRGMSYWSACYVWAALQLLCYALTLWLLGRRFQVRVWGFYPWALFYPVFSSIITGQDSMAVELVLCVALLMLADGHDEAGGALLSLTLYKFNLFLLLPLYLLGKKRYRALIAYALCGAVLAGLSAFLEPPSVYLALLPNIQRYTIQFFPRTMLGLRGLCAYVGWNALYPFAAVALAAYLFVRSLRMDFVRGFAMMVTAGVLCAYHVAWYDGALLVLPFGLAVTWGGKPLRALTLCLMLIPFWNAIPAYVTVVLLAFVMLYSWQASWTTTSGRTGEGRSLVPATA